MSPAPTKRGAPQRGDRQEMDQAGTEDDIGARLEGVGDVDRGGDVTRTFQKMSNECLNFSITSVERSGGLGGGTRSNTWAWGRSSVAVSPKHAELRLQRKVKDQIGTIPADGMYYLVADVTPAGADKTNVKIYYWDSVKDAATAIKGWASGTMLGCPDPGRLF